MCTATDESGTAATPFAADKPTEMDRCTFVYRFGGVYEHSPWVAEMTFDAGLDTRADTAEGLSELMAPKLDHADYEAQLGVLRAHPDLAGKLAMRGGLTADSTSEQAGAGLDRCSSEEFERFQALNEAYTTRFGFPFILAVKGYDRRGILEVFEQRVGNTVDDEFAEAIRQVHRIARFRLIQIAEAG